MISGANCQRKNPLTTGFNSWIADPLLQLDLAVASGFWNYLQKLGKVPRFAVSSSGIERMLFQFMMDGKQVTTTLGAMAVAALLTFLLVRSPGNNGSRLTVASDKE